MNAKTILVALFSASTMLACAAEEAPAPTADESVGVKVELGDGKSGDAEGVPTGGDTGGVKPAMAAERGWCVHGFNPFTQVNWSYCCYESGCESWSQ